MLTKKPHLLSSKELLFFGLTILLSIALLGCESRLSQLEQIKRGGELRVITHNSATTYYESHDGYAGLEYDMALLFAQRLGIKLHMVIANHFADIIPLIQQGKADFAAAGLAITEQHQKQVLFSSSYQSISPQLVYRAGNTRPQELNRLDGTLEIISNGNYIDRLQHLQQEYINLNWQENSELSSEELLRMVWEEVIDYTVADSNEVAINRRYYPELRVAQEIGAPQYLAWAFAKTDDLSLYNEVQSFFHDIKENGTLEHLIERYYGHVQKFDYVNTRRYLNHIDKRLPKYEAIFKQASLDSAIDWRLLAAMGYQESHWNPNARSPTGVRGIMMLTLNTTRELGLDNRLDPVQSIHGGLRYLEKIRARIPARVNEPDRTWMALTAYNIGYGHLEDARIIALQNGDNPDYWVNIKKSLPLLSQKKWYRQLRHGYARGHEALQYVENIRSYYDILVRKTDEKTATASAL
ncbi:MAG: membrane-bound lytic murein transglycosylase MltF [Gammaproteobacteria bacterium]|nr:membrane-bound lytic murein transglycosylase MltF [Gammaproteobacteria bacterium]